MPRAIWPRTVAVVVIILLLGGLAFVLARAWPALFPDLETLQVDPGCDLRLGPCERDLPNGGSIVFSILPRAIPLMKTLHLQVELRATNANGVLVDITGLNMNMGLNRVALSALGGGHWRGETLLPVCSANVMQWEASVWLDRGSGLLAVPYRFSTRRSDLATGGGE